MLHEYHCGLNFSKEKISVFVVQYYPRGSVWTLKSIYKNFQKWKFSSRHLTDVWWFFHRRGTSFSCACIDVLCDLNLFFGAMTNTLMDEQLLRMHLLTLVKKKPVTTLHESFGFFQSFHLRWISSSIAFFLRFLPFSSTRIASIFDVFFKFIIS